jgi:hypothetical protein
VHALQAAPPFETTPQHIQYVNPQNITGPWNGMSIATGFATLDFALNSATNPLLTPGAAPDLSIEVRLLGNQAYVPDGSVRFPNGSTNARHSTFLLPRQVLRVSGGWLGTEPLNATAGAGRPSTLSGHRGLADDITDNCYHVVVPHVGTFPMSSDTQWLKGVVVEGGYADGSTLTNDGFGGGVLVTGGRLRLTEVTVRDNFAIMGGGVAAKAEPNPLIPGQALQPHFWSRRSTVGNCIAEQDGGGLYLVSCASVHNVNLVCKNNASGRDGGGIFVGSHITDNSLVNSVLHDNVATDRGGAVFVSNHVILNAGFRVVNCTIAYNTAGNALTLSGSGMFVEFDSAGANGLNKTKIFNTILYSNPASNVDNLLLGAGVNHQLDVSNCFIGPRATTGLLVNGTQGWGLPFIDAAVTGEIPGWVNPLARNFRLTAISRCIDQATDWVFTWVGPGADFMDLDSDFLYWEQTIPPTMSGQIQEELPREHYMGDEQWLTGAVSTREVDVPGAGMPTFPDIGEDAGQVIGQIADIGAFEYRIYATGP